MPYLMISDCWASVYPVKIGHVSVYFEIPYFNSIVNVLNINTAGTEGGKHRGKTADNITPDTLNLWGRHVSHSHDMDNVS